MRSFATTDLRGTSVAIACFLWTGVAPAEAADIASVWIGPDGGAWAVASNWSPQGVPHNDPHHYFVTIAPAAPLTVLLNGLATIDTLSVAGGSTLKVAGSGTGQLNLFKSPLALDGTLLLAPSAGAATLGISANIAALGRGVLRLDGADARIIGPTGKRLTIGADVEVRGRGKVGVSPGNLRLTNHGAIIADDPDGPLALYVYDDDNLSDGQLRADGGTLLLEGTFSSSKIEQTGGVLEAMPGALVEMKNVRVLGGAAIIHPGGELRGWGSIPPPLNLGAIVVPPGGWLQFDAGVVTNEGTIRVEGPLPAAGALLIGPPGVELAGAGSLQLAGPGAEVGSLGASAAITIGADQLVHGAGTFGGPGMRLANLGTIRADAPGEILLVQATEGSNVNAGVIEAVDGGLLHVYLVGPTDNRSGTIRLAPGCVGTLLSAQITGGIHKAEPGSHFVCATGGGYAMIDATLEGNLIVKQGAALPVRNVLHHEGSMMVMGGKVIVDSAEVNLEGGGEIVLDGALSSSNEAVNRLVNSASYLIRGRGAIGGAISYLTNHGTIRSEDGELVIDCFQNTFMNSNDGLLEAAAGSALVIKQTGLVGTGGVVRALPGGTVRLESAAVLGGTIVAEGTGAVVCAVAADLDGVTIEATVTVPNDVDVTVRNTIVNEGKIELQSTFAFTDLIVATPTVTLEGGGTIAMSSVQWNRIIGAGGLRTLINGSGHTIQGAGRIGNNTNLDIVNHGSIVADSTVALTIDATSAFTNLGLLDAAGAGGMTIAPAAFLNSGEVLVRSGSKLARNGTFVQSAGATTVDGLLTVVGGGALQLDGGVLRGAGSIAASVLNQGGTVEPGTADPGDDGGAAAAAGTMTIAGSYTQGERGTLETEIAGTLPGAEHDRLAASGEAFLGGTLRVERVGGFVPSPADEFEVLASAGGVVGTFDTVESCDEVVVLYQPTSVRVRFPGPLPNGPDLNGDGLVDGADIGLLLRQWGECDVCCAADLSSDGAVNGEDLKLLLGAWGANAGHRPDVSAFVASGIGGVRR